MDKRTTSDTRKTRQEAVTVRHRDMSTEQIASSLNHAQTLISMYELQRTRSLRAISEANSDIRTCDRQRDELRADVATLNALIKQRRGC